LLSTKSSIGGTGGKIRVFAAQKQMDRIGIVGVAVSIRGSDMGESTPMMEQIERRTGRRPSEMLVDGGYGRRRGC
jgi:hypothetical protein